MGRLFEYSRFNNDEDINQDVGASDCKQKEFMQNSSKSPQTTTKMQKYETVICPSYSELYPSDNDAPSRKEDAMKRTKSMRRNVENAIKKYHQLSKCLMHRQDDDDDDDDDSGDDEKDDCKMIAASVSAPEIKKPKVYDCMRDFLRKKFFQQNVSTEESEAAEYGKDDYLSIMASYNVKDINDDDDDNDVDDECLLVEPLNYQTRSRCTRLVDGGCWPNKGICTKRDEEECDEINSDAVIKDRCHLLPSEGRSPKTEKCGKSPKRKPIELPFELRDATWFQPNISGKAATARLIKEAPGAFIIRQSTSVKQGNLILCLRMESKVKKFVILGSPRCYKIKGAKKEFSSLKALVTHHSVMAEQLPVTLALPRTIDEKPSYPYLDDFDTFESLQILGILKFLQSKNLEFS